MNFKGLYQVYKTEDMDYVSNLDLKTIIPDFGQEDLAISKGFDIIIQVNPDWDYISTVKKYTNNPKVAGWYLPDEPNMNPNYPIGRLKEVVKKIEEVSNKPTCICIANINGGRDYKKWRETGADILFADIYPYHLNPNDWMRKQWEKGTFIGTLLRNIYSNFRLLSDIARMKKATKAGYKEVVAVTQGFGSKKSGGKFYFPTPVEYGALVKRWKGLGINNFFVFCWDMYYPNKNYRGIKIDKDLIKEVMRW